MNKSMKIWFFIAGLLVVSGCIIFGGVMTVFKWDFTKLQTVKYETNNYDIDEVYKNISIVTNTANIEFVYSQNGKTSVVCYEHKNTKHSVLIKDDTLVIEVDDTRKWYEHVGVSFGTPRITVYIPQGEYGSLSIKTSTGHIEIPTELNATVEELNLTVSTGGIKISNVVCEGNVNINVSTGKTKLTDIKCKNLTSSGSTGEISLYHVIAQEKMSIQRSTGNVKMDRTDAGEMFIKTHTGNIVGTLLTDKIFIAHANTGKVNVPKTVNGGKCELITHTGNIKINIR